MAEVSTGSAGHRVRGAPAEVRDRLERRLVAVRSVWFPSPKELRTWEAAGVPAYVVWQGDDGLELGPRLGSMWASAFSPVLRGSLQAEGAYTRIALRRAWPRLTLAVLVIWWLCVIGWGAILVGQVTSGDQSPLIGVWWVILFGATTLGPLVGWQLGGAQLDEALPWVLQVAGEDVVEGEDW